MITGRGKRSLEDHFDRSFELEYYLEEGGKLAELAEMRRIAEMAEYPLRPPGRATRASAMPSWWPPSTSATYPSPSFSATTSCTPDAGILAGMLAVYEHYGHSVVALKEVPPEDISSYGCAAVNAARGQHRAGSRTSSRSRRPGEAPSNLAVMGRYVFGPEIFDVLAETKPGRGGEIQLTDAIKTLGEHEPVYGWTFRDGRFDVGNKLDYLEATVELALEREDIGPAFRQFLVERLGRDDF